MNTFELEKKQIYSQARIGYQNELGFAKKVVSTKQIDLSLFLSKKKKDEDKREWHP